MEAVYLDPGVLFWRGICVKVRGRPRACLSIFIYGETNKQFRAPGNIVYGKTGKIKEIALSQYPRQTNCNVNRTKSYDWIASKLTPVDAS